MPPQRAAKTYVCLISAPHGAIMRHTPKPWEAIGISRATWYRHGKPTEKPPRPSIARRAQMMGAPSVRTLQRIERVMAANIELAALILQGRCKPGQAEAIIANPAEHRRFRKWLKAEKKRIAEQQDKPTPE